MPLISHPYYLGYTLGASRVVPPAPLPASLKDPAVIARRQQENAEDAARVSYLVPTAGCLRAYHLIDDAGAVVSKASAGDLVPPLVARKLVKKLAAIWAHGWGMVGGDWSLGEVAIVGFGVHAALKVACVEALVSNHDHTPPVRVPAVFHCGDRYPSAQPAASPLIVDPYTLVCNSDTRKYVSLPEFLARLGVPPTVLPLDEPIGAAELARLAAKALQLFSIPAGAVDANDEDAEEDDGD